MKHKQHGSIHLILLGMVLLLIVGTLTYVFLNNIAPKSNISTDNESVSQVTSDNKQDTPHIEFKDWNVRFSSNVTYDLIKNSSTGNETAYFITNKELAKVCVTPDSAWLGIIRRYEDPNEKIISGQYSGQTPNQLFSKTGMTITDKLYVFSTIPQSCTRNGPEKPEFDQAAKKLESEIKSLQAY